MIDYERFDAWVAQHDNDIEARELSRVVIENLVVMNELLGSTFIEVLGRELVRTGLLSSYDTVEGQEAWSHVELGDPISGVEQLFDDVDLLNFHFAQRANGLKCYAMTGMIEGEQPDDLYDAKKSHLSELVEWGHMITGMIDESRAPLASFRSVAAAAKARLAIDLNLPVETTDFAHLAAMFREGTSEQVKKTLQNQISARQLEVTDRRQLLPESALQFLKGASGFPSIWMIAEEENSAEDEVTEPVFVPVCPAIFSQSEIPFIPSEVHQDGYRVGAGENACIFKDYWEALDHLSRSQEPAFVPAGRSEAIRCKPTWTRIDRKLLLNEIASRSTNGGHAKSLTEQAHQVLASQPAIQTHDIGHTDKVYRYRRNDGAELALERRVGEPWLYVRFDDLFETPDVASIDVEPSRTGRNSNLNALPTFRDQTLRKFKISSLGDVQAVLEAI